MKWFGVVRVTQGPRFAVTVISTIGKKLVNLQGLPTCP